MRIAANMAASVMATIFHFRDTSGGCFLSMDLTGAALAVGVGVASWRPLGGAWSLLEILGSAGPGIASMALEVCFLEVLNRESNVDRKVEVQRVAEAEDVVVTDMTRVTTVENEE
jgi:hypothetical protein